MGKKRDKQKQHEAEAQASPAVAGQQAGAGPPPKLKRKVYEKHLDKLHAELVNLQEWVKLKGLKVCIVFEGRDGAGKGGVIKAITERVSPRVFRVMALPAPTEREKTQMYAQRYLPHLPGGRGSRDLRPELVQPGGGGAGDGILYRAAGPGLPGGACRTSRSSWWPRAFSCSSTGWR